MEFVTFKIAKKLKEKGFNIPCIYAYCEKGGWNMYRQVHEPITHILRTDGNPFGSFYIGKNWNVEYKTNKNKIRCSAPTISQVLKWLREEKKIHIQILFACPPSKWEYIIVEMTNNELRETYTSFKSYEQAALAGIEYVLDNLI